MIKMNKPWVLNMEEIWIETKIWFYRKIFENKEDYKTLLLEIYKPIVSGLERKSYFVTFHFFFEPDPDALFRVRITNEECGKETKQVIEKRVSFYRELIQKFEFNDNYHGEEDSFKQGWEIAQKFFEISCRFAISRIDDSFEKGKEYNDGKLIHCFCNQVHISYQEEINFYLGRLKNLGIKIEKK